VFIVSPKQRISNPKRTHHKIFSVFIRWEVQIMFTVLPESFRYVAEHSPERRRVIKDLLPLPEDE